MVSEIRDSAEHGAVKRKSAEHRPVVGLRRRRAVRGGQRSRDAAQCATV